MQQVFDKADLRITDCASIISTIAHGRCSRPTKHYTVEDGKRKLTGITTAGPTYRERLQAVDMTSRLTGDYDRVHEAVKAEADEWKALVRDVFKDVSTQKGAVRAVSKPLSASTRARGKGKGAKGRGGERESQGAGMESPSPDTTED